MKCMGIFLTNIHYFGLCTFILNACCASREKNETSSPLLWLTGYVVAQLVEALPYKPEGRGFDFRWSHWDFSMT
jgi:hypothetical protein